eukprot:GEMP01125661.1.p1 GENE.GEMP01125661.1~~GEMP01125661.1.p1  ORF type:complete len:126 (+),score=27.76 GEMP01125661.1:20-397(+)
MGEYLPQIERGIQARSLGCEEENLLADRFQKSGRVPVNSLLLAESDDRLHAPGRDGKVQCYAPNAAPRLPLSTPPTARGLTSWRTAEREDTNDDRRHKLSYPPPKNNPPFQHWWERKGHCVSDSV